MPYIPGVAQIKTFKGLQGGQEQPARSSGVTKKVKGAKQPRVRPPRGIRDGLPPIIKRLPGYTGPYNVGTMEIELPVQTPQTFSHITRHGRHVLHLKTVLFTVYYPASKPPPPPQGPEHKNRHPSRQLWLGRPRIGMMHGYSKFASLNWIGMPMFLPVCWTKLPAWRNAPLSDQVPKRGVRVQTGKRRKARRKEERLANVPLVTGQISAEGERRENVKFPLIMFSHGLGGTRTMYSSICGELASYGYVVCAVEHRDGSGPRTYINHVPPEQMSDESLEDEKQGHSIDRGPRKLREGHDILDYIFPQNNAYDTNPDNEKGVDRELRDAQIELRMAEFDEAYAALKAINAGDGASIAERNIRKKGYQGSSSHGLDEIDWSTWQDRVHLTSATALGHSFGAATCVEMLRHRDRFTWLTQGIILDIWSAGTRPTRSETDRHRLHTPILAVNTEAFTYWPSNFDFVSKLTSEANPCPTWLTTVRGTIHMAPSDFVLLYPHLCGLFLKSTANPKRAIDLHVDMCLAFLHNMLPDEMTAPFAHAYPRDEYLSDTPIQGLEEIPSRYIKRPDEKYMASRLKIRQEWKWRLAPTYSIGRKWMGEKKDEIGEVWVHTRPGEGEVEAWVEKQYGARGTGSSEADDKGVAFRGLEDGNVKAEDDGGPSKNEDRSRSDEGEGSRNED